MVEEVVVDTCMHGCRPYEMRTILDAINNPAEVAEQEGLSALKEQEPGDPENGEIYMDEKKKQIDPDNDKIQPYVGFGTAKRHITISAASSGIPMESYYFLLRALEKRREFDAVKKTEETLYVSPQSTLYAELVQKKQQAQQNVRQTIANIADLYKQKQLLEHDLRKLEKKQKHFEEDDETALKADFVDLVDAQTGQHSILNIQQKNIFPSITADFYALEEEDDLEDGHLKNLPENEKAILAKKHKLYQSWKDEFGDYINELVGEIKQRKRSIEASIEQTEEWLEPYVRDMETIESTDQLEDTIEFFTSPSMPEMYANLIQNMKLIAYKDVGGPNGGPYYDVLVVDVNHASLAAASQPASGPQGPEKVTYEFKEYIVCKHVFDQVFKRQVEDRQNQIRDVIQGYLGTDIEDEDVKYVPPPEPGFLEQLKLDIYEFFGKGDNWLCTDEQYHGLRHEVIGPGFPMPLYLDMKFGIGLFVMK